MKTEGPAALASAPAAPRPVAGSPPVPASVSLRGDRIERPTAAPFPDPNGLCPATTMPSAPVLAADAAGGVALGVGVAVAAPEIGAALGSLEIGDGLAAAAGAVGRVAAGASGAIARGVAFGGARFHSAESFGEMLGNKVVAVVATAGENAVQGLATGAIGGAVGAAIDHAFNSHAAPLPTKP